MSGLVVVDQPFFQNFLTQALYMPGVLPPEVEGLVCLPSKGCCILGKGILFQLIPPCTLPAVFFHSGRVP